jgi:lipoprotein-anchoring transpeptidase ErfK/SrfK
MLFMKPSTFHFSIFRSVGLLLIAVCFAASCQPGSVTTSNANAANSPNAAGNANANSSASNSNANVQAAREADFPITMPVIDAMFTDDEFATAAKSGANLTDEEIGKVRDAARNFVLQMNGQSEEDANRSTRGAAETTQRELGKLIGEKKASDLIAFARTRWAGDFGPLNPSAPNSVPTDTRIVVNSPAYRMDVFKEGELVKTYKIGIGYPEFPLPTGLRQAKEIIFNPTWTPPDEPWVTGKFQPGKKIEAGSKLNPLGPIKIPIGYPSLIHGGKDPSRLGTFASHGCVGLTSSMVQDAALEIAAMGGNNLTAEQIKEYAKNKDETKNVPLANPVAVELRYETIVVEDGKVNVYRDVYERGTNTEENLQRVLSAFGVSMDQLSESERSRRAFNR